MSEPKRSSLAELEEALALAEKELQQASVAEREASSRKTAAINGVNKIQKQINETLAVMQKAAHNDTDWARDARPRYPIPSN